MLNSGIVNPNPNLDIDVDLLIAQYTRTMKLGHRNVVFTVVQPRREKI